MIYTGYVWKYIITILAYKTILGEKPLGHLGESWSGPYIDLNPKAPIFPYQSEDPCIFQQMLQNRTNTDSTTSGK